MNWNGIVSALEALAPTLAGMLGGPLASMAVGQLEQFFGLTPGSGTPETVSRAVATLDPGKAVELAKVDADLRAKLMQAGVDMAKIAADDRASARAMQSATRSWAPPVLALLVVLGYAGLQWFLVTHVVDAGMREIVLRTLGTVDAALGLVLAFFFGSSASSRDKDSTIANLSK